MNELQTKGIITLPPPIPASHKNNRTREITMDSIQRRNAHDMVTKITNKLQKTNVLTIHGDNDKVVPVTNADRYHELIPNHTKKIIEGADHNFNGLLHIDKMVQMISEFCRL